MKSKSQSLFDNITERKKRMEKYKIKKAKETEKKEREREGYFIKKKT